MTLLVFGSTGQVARELRRCDNVIALGRDIVDLRDAAFCAEIIGQYRPIAVINAAAYTAVDRAEEDEALARAINADAPAAMAKACVALDIPFIHISTDYVFDGTGELPRCPSETAAPQNAYGRTKFLGEEMIRAIGGRYAIVRTSWVFSASGSNFVKTMLKLSASRDNLAVVADQVGGPTSARTIADACIVIAAYLAEHPEKYGTYHFSGTPDVSWHQFAQEIFALAGRATNVTAISTQEYPTPAARPLNSRLDCQLTQQVFGISRPNWRICLESVLNEVDIVE